MAAAGRLTPARMTQEGSIVIISSSPEFPSICDLVPKTTKKTELRSGSNAAPLPDDAPTTFKSAASVWQSSRTRVVDAGMQGLRAAQSAMSAKGTAEVSTELAVESSACGLPKGRDKYVTALASGIDRNVEQPKSRYSPDELVTEDRAAEAPAPKKRGRKPKTTKDAATTQTTIPKGKVTKPAAKEEKKKRHAETVSKHFVRQPSAPDLVSQPVAEQTEDGPVILEPAMRRRMDWTPPRENVSVQRLAESSATKEVSSTEGHVRVDVFKSLQDAYGRKPDAGPFTNDTAVLTATITDVLGKRKLIEMVSPIGNRQKTPETSPTKPKAIKKKPRTITELATAAYRQAEESTAPEEGPKGDTLLDYLGSAGQNPAEEGKSSRSKGKGTNGPTKPKPKATQRKKETGKQKLLSPTSAMRQVAKQDFVFGTASQLATEDDPELLRALHEAMKVSNQADSDPFVSPNSLNSNLPIRRRPGAAGLWVAGARDEDGELLDLEMLDLTRSSPLLRDKLLPEFPSASEKAAAQAAPDKRICIEVESSDDTVNIGVPLAATSSKPSRPVPSNLVSQRRIQLNDVTASGHDRHRSPTPASEANFEPPPSNQEQHQLLLSQSKSPGQAPPELPPRPNFELYSDARLAKEIALYGFKAVKKRAAMIALLDECWTSRHKAGLASAAAQLSTSMGSAKPTASPSRVTGRRRKGSASSLSDATEPQAPSRRDRKKPVRVAGGNVEAPQAEKRQRGRPKKNISAPPDKVSKEKAPTSLKRAKSPLKPASPSPATPRRRRPPAESVVEIPNSDSDDPFASTPPSSPEQKDDVFSSPPEMDLSVTEDTETSLIASPTSQQVSLFRYITQAVVSAPPTKDPAKPSWHEKMLMYDPIILEDLTAWLNSGQLDRVGYDGEVAPGDVKKWCESKSVCCLWRVNLNGKERKRF
ncbi:hypothetical protein C8A03DRAFT_32642 [Achaetomium macrosporum]|uniref:Structure-specific endonuclease subunit SLX4 n=1 Tax=Achaetomium macrosporum TaxID=79813 RepID=A0AAN7CC40_9PEZI|nr:hypothetical protein C8A03DRAFT_32642 [Achaetomium macrosporum]